MNRKQNSEGAIPNAAESTKFWSGLWDNDVQHNRSAEWLKELKGEATNNAQENAVITMEMMKGKVRNLPNWKAQGTDGVQGYWPKNLTTLHDKIVKQVNDVINNSKHIPAWLTEGKTVLCQKDKQRDNAVDNF